MSSITSSVEDFVAQQPRLTWRRNLLRGLIRSLGFKVLWRMTVTGLEHVPTEGPTMLMMNHISLLDPVIFMGVITSRYVIPMSKSENMRNPLISPFIMMWGAYPINRGQVDRKALMNSIELLKSGQLILMAPEGTRHPEGMARPKDGVAYIATKADAQILPAGISGAVGWDKNLKRLRRTDIQVNFGRPFKFKTEGRKRIPRDEMAVMMDEAMYQVAQAVPDESLRGVYSDLSLATTNHLDFLTTPEKTPNN